MDQLFRPSSIDPLAFKAGTAPYIDNICRYLSPDSARLYRSALRCFEEGTSFRPVSAGAISVNVLSDRFDEETLALLVRDGHFFNGQPIAQYHHDDLVLVIMLNKLESTITRVGGSQADVTSPQSNGFDTVGNNRQETSGSRIKATASAPIISNKAQLVTKRTVA